MWVILSFYDKNNIYEGMTQRKGIKVWLGMKSEKQLVGFQVCSGGSRALVSGGGVFVAWTWVSWLPQQSDDVVRGGIVTVILLESGGTRLRLGS